MKYLLLLPIAFLLAACDPPSSPSADKVERQATQQLASQASITVGIPAIKNFTEKRQLKTIYELRDQADLVTYSYTIDLNGKRHKVCPTTSVGFGIPYSTQYVNPNYIAAQAHNYGYATLPQAEPNGLFMPGSADGTWVICLAPDGKTLAPTYVEPRIVVYLFEMP